jgi:glycosyltransferase involved in cell wall biosynthesis
MRHEPRVSVNIPTYNRAHLLRHAITSVLRQGYPNLEIVVIDDGSTDATRAILDEYGDRVRYFAQPNAGLGAARNAAMARSTGDLIAFLDSDDEWFDFKLELQVEVLERMPAVGSVFTEFVILKDDGTRIPKGSRTWLSNPVSWPDFYPQTLTSGAIGLDGKTVGGDFPIYAGRMYRRFLADALVLPTTAVARRDAIGSLRFTEGMTIFEDWEFFARLARDRDVAFLDIETAINRGHDGPERLTRCSALAKAQCYDDMVARVWGVDPDFSRDFPGVAETARGGALLAVAREALLTSRRDEAKRAVARWKELGLRVGRARASAFSVLANLPIGGQVLKGSILGQKLLRVVVRRDANHPVNPSV